MLTIGKRYVKGWLVSYAFMLAFFLVMVPSLAYADTYVATEDSAVRAAMVYLGYDPDEGESTNKLVTAFYDATSGDEYTGWQSFVNGLYQPLDTVNYNEQWWSPADGFMFSFQVDGARADAAKIYAQWKKSNSGSGGGSGGGATGETLDVEFAPNVPDYGYLAGLSNRKIKNYSDYITSGATLISGVTVTVGPNVADKLRELAGQNKQVYAMFYPNLNSTDKTAVRFVIADSFTETINTVGGHSAITKLNGTNLIYWSTSQSNYNPFFVVAVNNITIDGDHIDAVYTSDTVRVIHSVADNTYDTSTVMYIARVEVGGSTPEPEPEPEPEPPTPPEPPRDPTPPTPDPTQPSQTIDLQGIIDRLDIIIRNQVVLINWLDDAFASVTANIQWLGELIDESFGWLWEVLDNLQSSIDSGINRITTWLEMIYNKIGGKGGTVSRPNIDTPTPWDDFLSWLEGILQRLLDLIFGVTPAALQNLLSGLADLTTKFPFSIPWDLAALFALFVHEPVTPVFDVPLMVPFLNAPLPIHVDCTQWDGLAAICRDGETVMFAAWLLLKIPDLYKHLNDVSGAD